MLVSVKNQPYVVEEQTEEAVVSQAIRWIRNALEKTVYKGTLEVGSYLLDTFFEGNPERVRSQNPFKNSSFRRLAAYCGSQALPVSRTWLHTAVSLAVMERLLPQSAVAYPQLGPSHKATLLPLRDPEAVEQMAQTALARGLSVRQLKHAVNQELAQRDKDSRGRKPKPMLVKTLDHSIRLLSFDRASASPQGVDIDTLSPADREHALKTAQELIANLKQLVRQLNQKRVQESHP